MPWYPVNTFRAMTPIGEGIQNVSRMLFGGATGEERALKAAQAEQARQHADLYAATIAEKNAKMAAERQAREDMAAAPRRMMGMIFGNQPKADLWMDSMKNGSTPVEDFTTPIGSQVGPSQQQADIIPAQFDPATVAKAARLLAGVHAAQALPGNDNMAHLAKFVGELEQGDARAGIANGTADPTRIAQGFFATSGKAPYDNMGGTGTFNLLTGDQRLNALGDAKVATEGAHAVAYRAAGRASDASAGEHTARRKKVEEETNQLRSDVLVPVLDPDTGLPKLDAENKPILMRQSARGAILQRTEGRKAERDNADANKLPKEGAQAQPRKLTTNDTKLLRSETDLLLQALDHADADEATKRAIVAEAERQWQAGAAGHQTAVKAAIDKLAPQGFERGGFMGFGKSHPVGGLPMGGPAMPAAPGGAPKPATSPPKAPPSAIEFYRINANKPGVKQQFIDKYGYDPDGA